VTPGRGHNGGPPIDDPTPSGGQCRWCRHWTPPPEAEVRAFEYFRLGLSRKRVKRPAGRCGRVLLAPGRPLAFAATNAEFSCLNFDEKPRPERPSAGGFVTIHEGEQLVWSGNEEDLPDRYR